MRVFHPGEILKESKQIYGGYEFKARDGTMIGMTTAEEQGEPVTFIDIPQIDYLDVEVYILPYNYRYRNNGRWTEHEIPARAKHNWIAISPARSGIDYGYLIWHELGHIFHFQQLDFDMKTMSPEFRQYMILKDIPGWGFGEGTQHNRRAEEIFADDFAHIVGNITFNRLNYASQLPEPNQDVKDYIDDYIPKKDGCKMQINRKLISRNFNESNNRNIEYIVIHDTGNQSKGASADMHQQYFNAENRNASAHYFVDDTQILQAVLDEDISWGVGDGNGKHGITNQNSINVEMCVNADGDFAKTLKKTIELTKHLMQKYGIDIQNVVRHYDASKKICPAVLSKNQWEGWQAFMNAVKSQKNEHWGEEFWKHCNDNGLTIHEKRFDDNITRAEMFALCSRLLKLLK